MLGFGAQYALRNLLRTPVRSLLTLISIALIISLYVLLSAIATSFADQMRGLMSQEGVDVVVQSKFATNPLSSSLTSEQIERIGNIRGVKSRVPIVIGRKRLQNRDIVYLFGISDIARMTDRLGISLTSGRLFQPGSEEVLVARRILMSQALENPAELVFPEQAPLPVVGSFHSWISFFNASVICDLDCARRLLGKEDKTNILFLTLDNPADAERLNGEINRENPNLLAIKAGEYSGAGMVKNLFYLADIIALVTLLIACAILINTFLVKVHERTFEIGILHSIGWHKGMIVYALAVESLLLTLAGGLLGFAVSIGFLEYLHAAYPQIVAFLPARLDGELFLHSLLVCLLIALVSVMVPAWQAARKNIVSAINGD